MRRLLLISLFIALQAPAQDHPGEQTINDCFMAYKKSNRAISQNFCVTEKVKIKLNDNTVISSRIGSFSSTTIIMEDGTKVQVSNIKWIKRSKPVTESAVLGGLLSAAGIAILIPVISGDADLKSIGPKAAAGVGLVVAGIIVIRPRKYRMEKGDQLNF